MQTLAELSRQVARLVFPDFMVTGTATGGSTSTLIDTTNLTQPNQWFEGGTLWILSGTHAGEVYIVTGYADNALTFATVTGAIAAGVRYAVARATYPYQQMKSAIMQALDDTYVEADDSTLEGDGETLEFTLPDGVYNVKEVWIENPDDEDGNFKSAHWKEKNGKLRFDYGFPPFDGWTIHLKYKDQHAELVDSDDEIDGGINLMWLRYMSARYLLDWGMGIYKAQAEYRIEERMNLVLERLKTLTPRNDAPDVMIRTAEG